MGGGVGLWASRHTAPDGQPREQKIAAVAPGMDDGDDKLGSDDKPRGVRNEVLAQAKDGPDEVIKRGEYLVNTVARCGDCHTPRTKTGELDMSKHLQGAPTYFTPKIKPKGEWADRATDITMSGRAGLWSEAKMIKFLSAGARRTNRCPPTP